MICTELAASNDAPSWRLLRWDNNSDCAWLAASSDESFEAENNKESLATADGLLSRPHLVLDTGYPRVFRINFVFVE